jgi:hypothetical protein
MSALGGSEMFPGYRQNLYLENPTITHMTEDEVKKGKK